MINSLQNSLPKFEKCIELKKDFTPDEVIQKMSYYHNSNRENILKAFPNLGNFTDGTVSFRESINSGYACLIMEGHKDRERKWSELIDKDTGQPMMRCG